MPKKKTCKAAAKRFRMGARGKVKYARPGEGHLLMHKSSRRKRRLKRRGVLNPLEGKRIAHLLSS